jgi:hypothetical protein
MRIRTAIVAVTVLAGFGIAPVGGFASSGQCRGIETAPGGWTANPLPATPAVPVKGSSAIVATSAVGQDPSVELATDGIAVFRTADAGCTWQTVFTLGAADYYSGGGAATAYSVTNIANGHDATPVNRQTVYLAISPSPLTALSLVTLFGAAPPELLGVSHDGGRTFAIVQPQPSAANPIVPECVATPTLVFAPPADQKTIYVQCTGGLAQSLAEELLAHATVTLFRSTDSGLTWSVVGLPAAPAYTTDAHWVAPGNARNELWSGGYVYNNSHNYLAVWHSTDAGDTWKMSLPDPARFIANETSVVVAVDTTPGPGQGQVAVINAAGTFVSTDLGKHWRQLRSVTFTDGNRPPVAGFFLHHVLHMVFAGELSCKASPAIARYPSLAGKPVTFSFPSKLGSLGGWASDTTFAVLGRGFVADGLAHYCDPTSAATITKLLSLRVR